MTENEYNEYINSLKQLKEVELIKKIIDTNKHIYNGENLLSISDYHKLKTKSSFFVYKGNKTIAICKMLGTHISQDNIHFSVIILLIIIL